MKRIFCDASKELITAVFCVFVGSAGIVMNSNVVAMDQGVAGEQMTADGTQLWEGAVFHRNEDSSEIWITGMDNDTDPQKRRPFVIKLKKLTVALVEQLEANAIPRGLQKIAAKFRRSEAAHTVHLQGYLSSADGVNILKERVRSGQYEGYAIVDDQNEVVGAIWDTTDREDGKLYVLQRCAAKGYGPHAIITLVTSRNSDFTAGIEWNNFHSLGAIASAARKGDLKLKIDGLYLDIPDVDITHGELTELARVTPQYNGDGIVDMERTYERIRNEAIKQLIIFMGCIRIKVSR
jgi:hypothetical protein